MPKTILTDLTPWQNLFAKADQFRKLKNWDIIGFDLQLFGIVDSKSETTYYCCVIGTVARAFGLVAYRGDLGYSIYYKTHHPKLPPELNPDLGCEQDSLVIEFTCKDELSSSDLAIIKKLGLKYRGFTYPKFNDFRLGFFPEIIEEDQIDLMIDFLDVAFIIHPEMIKDSKFLKKKKNHIRTWKKSPEGFWSDSWIKTPNITKNKIKVSSNELRVTNLKKMKLKISEGIWEAGVFFFPGKVPTDDGRFYMPRLCVVADHQSGYILSHRVLEPAAEASLSLLNVILDAIKSFELMPREIFVHTKEAEQYILPTLDSLGVGVRYKTILPAVFNMLQEMNLSFVQT